MLSSHTVLFLMALLLVALLVEPVVKKLNLPHSIVLVLIGYIGSEFVVETLGIDTGIRWHNFGTLIFYLILPILIFRGALEIEFELLWKNIVPIGFLALPLMLTSALVIAACIYYGINHPGFPWVAALITGVLLSATDPAAVITLLKANNAPERLAILLEGESLFNDATAVVVFSLLIAIAAASQEVVSASAVLLRFLTVFFGGLGVGVVLGLMTCLIVKLASWSSIASRSESHLFTLSSVICAYASFLIAEDLLHFSGVMAILASGLIVGTFKRRFKTAAEDVFTDNLWDFLVNIAESMIFLLAGITVTLSMFSNQWIAIGLGIMAVIIARVVMIFGAFPLLQLLPGVDEVPLKHQLVLAWGGVRGTVTLALALSLPLTLDYWYTIQSIAYGVVLFTLFVQATSLTPLIRKLNISK